MGQRMKMGEEVIENFMSVSLRFSLHSDYVHRVDYRTINKFGAVGEMKIGRTNRSTRRKPTLG